MAVTSISSVNPAQSTGVPLERNLSDSIKENMDKSVKYQIVNKLLINKTNEESDSKSNKNKINNIELSSQALSLSQSQTSKQVNEEQASNTSNQLQFNKTNNSLSFSSEANDNQIQQTDPLAFDLDGNGIQTTGINQSIEFDIDGDGTKEQTSFIGQGDAFLAYDRNGNGEIDNGKELFGDQNGAKNGFEELIKYDENKDGLIDKNDSIYSDLKLVSLDNNNKLTTQSISEQNIQSINLSYNIQHQAINYYDSIEQTGQFTRNDGSTGTTADIMLGHR